MPRFSVIIPVYNRIDEVRDLMESLSQQSCKDFEVVIVEDGSSAPSAAPRCRQVRSTRCGMTAGSTRRPPSVQRAHR